MHLEFQISYQFYGLAKTSLTKQDSQSASLSFFQLGEKKPLSFSHTKLDKEHSLLGVHICFQAFHHSSFYNELSISINQNILFIKITLKKKSKSLYQTMSEWVALGCPWTQELIGSVWCYWEKGCFDTGWNETSTFY